jgi:hypothetical protein
LFNGEHFIIGVKITQATPKIKGFLERTSKIYFRMAPVDTIGRPE